MKKCEGDTHMLSAIEEANRYLADNSDDQYKNVIIVFTDGAENGMLDEQSSDRESLPYSFYERQTDNQTDRLCALGLQSEIRDTSSGQSGRRARAGYSDRARIQEYGRPARYNGIRLYLGDLGFQRNKPRYGCRTCKMEADRTPSETRR